MLVNGTIDWFIDWITVVEYGKFDQELAHAYFAKYTKDEHGEADEIIYQGAEPLRHVGSDDSSCRLRVADRKRFISFNPSRWNREENVFGMKLEQSLSLVDDIWRSLGQPRMQPGEEDNKGARITRLDVTTNLFAGSPELARELLRHFYRLKLLPDWQPNWLKETVYHGPVHGGRNRTIKVYLKGEELARRKSKAEKECGIRVNDEYIVKLADYLKEKGTVRIEYHLGHRYLQRKGLRFVGSVTNDAIDEYYRKELESMMSKVDDSDLSKLTPMERCVLHAYLNGEKPRELFAKNTFYKYRKAIREKTGWDIGNDNVDRISPKPIVITPVAAAPPSFYRHVERKYRDGEAG